MTIRVHEYAAGADACRYCGAKRDLSASAPRRCPGAFKAEANVCGKRCDHGSECLRLAGHGPDGHETQHGCVFYDKAGGA